MEKINVFTDTFRFLSNFYETSVVYNGLTYKNSEAAFQAQKCDNPDDRIKFTTLPALSAKRLGKRVKLRSDWESVKLRIMEDVVRAKFSQNDDLMKMLLSTGDTELEEGNTWNDTFWGISLKTGNGSNHLGRILMKLRNEFKGGTKDMITMPVELYTDGSCLRNPGAGGLAYIIRYWETPEGSDLPEPKTIEGNQGFRMTTNNRMEIMAAIYGLKGIMDLMMTGTLMGARQINLASDSEYLCNAINQRWIYKWMENNWMTSGYKGTPPKAVKNKDLWEEIISLQEKFQSMNITLTVTHIKGHNGHEFNEQADKLAVAASSNGTNHIIDTVYENTMNRR